MTAQTFVPQILPAWVRSLAAGIPEAPETEAPLPPPPLGTVFALSANAGWAVPPRRFELLFGRDATEVNIPLGVKDRRISRIHGRLVCHGKEWTMRNEGKLPMLFPNNAMLLRGQERLVEDAYTPVYIGDLGQEVHFLEIRVVGGKRGKDDCESGDDTLPPTVHDLSDVERLVLASLAQRYLRGLPHPQPVSWRQVTGDMNRLGGDRKWSDSSTARVVAGVRERLSAPGYRPRVPGLMRDEVFGEPLGNALNDNLIRALLQSTTLAPEHLDPFDDADG